MDVSGGFRHSAGNPKLQIHLVQILADIGSRAEASDILRIVVPDL
jgi:hypothetical protein